MPMIFDKQDRESVKAFAAFSLYLSLGPQRSLAEVGKKLQKSVTILGRWSAMFDWPARVSAHSAHLAIVEREAIEAAVKLARRATKRRFARKRRRAAGRAWVPGSLRQAG